MADKKIQLQDSTGTNNLFPIPTLPGIDTDNIIANASATTSSSYTATEDGYLWYFCNAGVLALNSISIINTASENTKCYGFMPLKSGDIISFSGSTTGWSVTYKLFGLKY